MLTGQGSEKSRLSEKQVKELCGEAFSRMDLGGKRILGIIPDLTRSGPIDMMFRVVYSLLADTAEQLDFMIALGTHPPMSQEAIYHRVGITREQHQSRYPKTHFFNHDWRDPTKLQTLGTIIQEEINELSGGLLKKEVMVTINKKVFDYDVLMIIGPTFPHEVVGFSGGNKYLFPGISGEEIIHLFHWLGALITSSKIIGIKDTPVRKVINKSASFLPMARICISLVNLGDDLHGLFIGTPEEASKAAEDLSEKIHIIYKDHPFEKVLSCAPEMYNDLWTGAKCMYKLEPVVADGGELIIYAPHITEVSVIHGTDIERIGYHVRDYFQKQSGRFKNVSGCVKAHSTHVKGIGTFDNHEENSRIQVTLATSIPETVCRRINLGYRNTATISFQDWQNREEEGILFVPKAGEMLYRLKNDPFRNT